MSPRFEAVVIGASAGGVDALKLLLAPLPASFPLPIFVVLHVPAEHRSLLVTVFRPLCELSVTEVEDKEPFGSPGAGGGPGIFFAPPGYHMVVDDRRALSLSVDEAVHWSRPSIDMLFSSAASVFGERLLAVLLTGANEDGADGIVDVARAGGCTVVQTPASALVATMPQAAISRLARERRAPDHVLDLPAIAALLAAIGTPVSPVSVGARP